VKSGFIAILGRPNAGKSTLLNALLQEKIAITSYKAETTRNAIQGILNRDDLQIVFVDTPGIHEAKTALGSYMNREAFAQVEGVDIIYYICDGVNGLHDEDKEIIDKIKDRAPVFLLLNKIDKLSSKQILNRVVYAQENFDFKEIIPLSALNQENLDELISTSIPYLKDEVLYYPQDISTPSSKEFRISEIIREKILICTKQEVPHLVAVNVESYKETEKKAYIDAVIACGKTSHKGIIIGKSGQMLKKINMMASKELSEFLNKKIVLNLYVKVEEDWLNKANKMFTLGYGNKNEG